MLILRHQQAGQHDHEHSCGDDHHAREHAHRDHNLWSAYLHVLADAMTSVLAIVALLAGKSMGWVWMDPAMGIIGAMVIAKWSQGLLRDTARILLDADVSVETIAEIRRRIEADGDNHIADLHIWKVGPVDKAALLCVTTSAERGPDHFKAMLADLNEIRHITVEVHAVVDLERRGGIFP
jgi:cation diffusion facilitator family transporter